MKVQMWAGKTARKSCSNFNKVPICVDLCRSFSVPVALRQACRKAVWTLQCKKHEPSTPKPPSEPFFLSIPIKYKTLIWKNVSHFHGSGRVSDLEICNQWPGISWKTLRLTVLKSYIWFIYKWVKIDTFIFKIWCIWHFCQQMIHTFHTFVSKGKIERFEKYFEKTTHLLFDSIVKWQKEV